MTATLDRSQHKEREFRNAPSAPKAPLVPGGRRPMMTVLSALLVFTSIAAFASLYARANRTEQVLVVTETIQQGQRIEGSMLGSADASLSGNVHSIPVADVRSLSGRRAAVTIPAGSLLTLADTTDSQPIAAGDAVVGMALKAGQLPSSGVEPGDHVMIVQTAAPGTPLASDGSAATGTADGGSTASGTTNWTVLVPRALVFDVQTSGSSSTTAAGASSSSSDSLLVSVEVSESAAPGVATASAADQVSLVLLPVTADGSASFSTNPTSNGSVSGAGGGNGSP